MYHLCSKSSKNLSLVKELKRLDKFYYKNDILLRGTSTTSNDKVEKKGWFDRLFGHESNIASPSVNRWAMFVPALMTHISLGSPYGWSAISAALARDHGMVVQAASDWSLDLATYPMSVIMAAGGISAALVGKWTLKVGVRKAMLTGGALFGSGLAIAGLGAHTHSVGLLYGGAMISGLGYGCAYTPPIQALINWFPDKRGLASGLVIGGFGSGALFFTPAINAFADKFSKMPTYLGQTADVIIQ